MILRLRAAAPLLRNDLARFTVVGDGAERNRLEQLVKSLGIEKAVVFCGWLSHAEVLRHMRSADVFVFPSVRDFGGGVVFEALAMWRRTSGRGLRRARGYRSSRSGVQGSSYERETIS